MLARSGPVLAVLTIALLGGCAGVPEIPIEPGSRVVARLYDADRRIELALANESHPDLQDVYSTQRSDASLKLAPDQLMGQLLSSLERAGFADYAQTSFSLPRGIGFLSLRQDGALRVFEAPAGRADSDTRQAYTRLKLVMDLYYSKVGSLQYVENEQGHRLFEGRP